MTPAAALQWIRAEMSAWPARQPLLTFVVSPNIQPYYGGDGDAFYIRLSPQPGPSATFEPISLDFGTLPQGQPSNPMTVTLTNYGNAALAITSITITGTDPTDFTETNTCGSSVPMNASCTVSVIFTPAEGGSRAANLVFTDRCPRQSADCRPLRRRRWRDSRCLSGTREREFSQRHRRHSQQPGVGEPGQ